MCACFCQFGDAFIDNTEREGGHPAPSIRTLVRITRRLLKTRKGTADFSLLKDEHLAVVERICEELSLAAVLDEEAKKPKDKDKATHSELLAEFIEKFVA